jgi:Family of unknown function (DUF695)
MASLVKKWPPPGRLRVELDGKWASLQGEMDGRVAVVRVNEGLKEFVGHPAYNHRVIASILFNSTRDDGLPGTKNELNAIDRIEDGYRSALQCEQESLLAIVVTTDGRRDLIFYTSSPQQAVHKFENDLRPLLTTHRVEFLVHPDAKWELYRDFTD